MGQKNPKGSITICNAVGRIRLRWRYLGKRYSINLNEYKKSNLTYAKKIAQQIEQDILFHQFDSSLYKYSFKEAPVDDVQKGTVEYFEEWVTEYKQMNCNINVDYYYLRNALKRWGNVSEKTIVAHLNKDNYSAKTYNSRLSMLNGFAKWLVKRSVWSFNPLEDVSRKKNRKVVDKKRLPFTKTEIRKILDAFKHDKFCLPSSRYKHSHYYPFIYFLFKTGVRNAEAIGLRISSIDWKNKRILIKETLARSINGSNAAARVRKETKNGKERELPLTNDLIDILQPLITGRDNDELVFISFRGLAIDDKMFQRRVFKPILCKLKIAPRVLYACRHTFGSRCIDEGMNPVITSFLMGNNPETALRNYVHQVSFPTKLPGL
jgi:integrase